MIGEAQRQLGPSVVPEGVSDLANWSAELVRRPGSSRAPRPQKRRKPRVSGAFVRADEGTRTLDLLHGKKRLSAGCVTVLPANPPFLRPRRACAFLHSSGCFGAVSASNLHPQPRGAVPRGPAFHAKGRGFEGMTESVKRSPDCLTRSARRTWRRWSRCCLPASTTGTCSASTACPSDRAASRPSSVPSATPLLRRVRGGATGNSSDQRSRDRGPARCLIRSFRAAPRISHKAEDAISNRRPTAYKTPVPKVRIPAISLHGAHCVARCRGRNTAESRESRGFRHCSVTECRRTVGPVSPAGGRRARCRP